MRPAKYLISIFSVLFSFSLCASLNTTDKPNPEKLKSELLYLQKEIKLLESTLYKDQSTQSRLNKQLAATEIQLGRIEETLRQQQAEFEQSAKRKKELIFELEQLNIQKSEQIILLGQLLQHVYTQNQREKWLMLFQQNDASRLSRLEKYYTILSHDRRAALQTLIQELKVIEQKKIALEETIKKLYLINKATQKKQQQLAEFKTARSSILNRIKNTVDAKTQSLSQLKEQQRSVENTLSNLHSNLKVLPEYIEPIVQFSAQKQKLRLPIFESHTLTSVFNHPNLSHKKTYIKAQSGTPVHAIYHGTVVFSEWLRGIGLLLIIDHGSGYMSLYGNNQILYKSVGEKVETGEVVARVGQSGGQAEPGLYFELRKDGIALEPSEWFKLS